MALPRMTGPEARNHETFTALLWATSYPGRSRRLPTSGIAAFATIADALVDLETSYFTDDAALAPLLLRTGGRPRTPEQAMYQFYPRVSEATLASIAEAPVGTHRYPDESATLILGCTLGAGPTLRLSGPGIATPATLRVGGLPDAFWTLRAQACRFPLGWDLLLVVDGAAVVALPRAVQIEVG